MSKILGYIIAAVGLAITVLSLRFASLIPAGIPKQYIMIGGIVIIIVGVALTMTKSSSNINQEKEEVPIYAGEGKKRKIVGYQRTK